MRCSVLIVNWNTRELLRECLESLESLRLREDCEVIVVDNASSDQSVEMVRRVFPDVKLLPQSANTGFAEGNNIAFRASSGELIMLLNPDTRVKPGAIEVLMGFLETHEDAGAVAGKFLNPDGSFQRYYNRFPTIRAILLTHFPVFQSRVLTHRAVREYFMLDDDFSQPRTVDQPAAAGLLVRRDGIAQDPFFMDPQFRIFFSDVDLAHRIWFRGKKIYYIPDAEIVHHHGGGGLNLLKKTDRFSIEYAVAFVRYLKKYRGWVVAMAVKGVLLSGMLVDALRFMARPSSDFKQRSLARKRVWKFLKSH
ncbi:MAG: glycosyltransferase family 2 protein [Patescibacteria group bacterium]